jgi:prolipoprotein diacylglyceryl transferase
MASGMFALCRIFRGSFFVRWISGPATAEGIPPGVREMVWDIDPVLFRIGPLQLRYYGLCFGLTILLGFHLLNGRFRERGYPIELATGFLLYALIGLLAGARLAHCIFYQPAYYLRHPLDIFKIWEGGIASHGGAVGMTIATILFARNYRIPFWVLGDCLVFAAALGAGLVRIGNFFNSEIIGRVTTVPWAVRFLRRDGRLRHPSQIYEAIGAFVILALLLILNRKRKDLKPGFLSGVFLVSYFSFRFVIEFFKEFQVLKPSSPLTMGQYLSIPFILFGIIVLVRAVRAPAPSTADESSGSQSPSET